MRLLIRGDARSLPLAAASVDCVVTSPPYWGLRDYGVAGQIGHEPTPDAYVLALVAVFREVWRVLRDDGTLWLNLGDSYHNVRTHRNGGAPTNTVHRGGSRDGTEAFARENRNKKLPGLKEKDLIGIPWRVALALQADGWYLRADIIWHKPNPMPEKRSLDRPARSHEYLFLLSKSERYFYDSMISTRTVWSVNSRTGNGWHFAMMPEALVEPCILAGCCRGGLILDPFIGSGTVGVVAERLGYDWVGVDLTYQKLAGACTAQRGLPLIFEDGALEASQGGRIHDLPTNFHGEDVSVGLRQERGGKRAATVFDNDHAKLFGFTHAQQVTRNL